MRKIHRGQAAFLGKAAIYSAGTTRVYELLLDREPISDAGNALDDP